LRTYAEALTYCGNRHPQTPIQAQFSLSHGTAFALRTGTLGPEAYADDVFRHPEQQRLERMIELVADATMTGRGARLEIKTGAGVENYAVTSVPGDPDQPLSRKDVIAKAETYMTPSLGATAAKAIIAAVMDAPFDSRFDLSAFAAGRKGKG
jgi:2-methylcitrate dehydratase PrpD